MEGSRVRELIMEVRGHNWISLTQAEYEEIFGDIVFKDYDRPGDFRKALYFGIEVIPKEELRTKGGE